MSRVVIALSSLSLVSLLCLWLGLMGGSPERKVLWVIQTGYWWMLALVVFTIIVWGVWIYRRANERGGFMESRGRLLDLLLLSLIALGMSWLEPNEFKILMDEPILVGTSFHMDHSASVGVSNRGYYIEGELIPMEVHLDKRPFLFPFLVSHLHGILGFQIENAFLMNHILWMGVVVLVYLFGTCLGKSRIGGWAAALLLISVPELIRSSSGAGFEMLNVFSILLTAFAARIYLKNPTPLSGLALLSASLLAAYCRYETVLLVPIAFAILFWGMWVHKKWVWSHFYLLIPVFLVPYLWRHQIFSLSPDSWQLYDRPDAAAPFAWENVSLNLKSAYLYWFDYTDLYANAPWVVFLGLLSLVVGILWIRKWDFADPENQNNWIWLGCVMALFSFYMFYFFGQFDDPIISRFSIPFYVLLALLPVAVFGRVVERYGNVLVLLIACFFLIIFAVPKVVAHKYTKHNFSGYEWHSIRAFLTEYGHVSGSVLAIDRLPIRWIMEGQSAMSVKRANVHPDWVRQYLDGDSNGWVIFKEIGRTDPQTGEFTPDPFTQAPEDYHRLPDIFETELLFEFIPLPNSAIRFHRVTAVHLKE